MTSFNIKNINYDMLSLHLPLCPLYHNMTFYKAAKTIIKTNDQGVSHFDVSCCFKHFWQLNWAFSFPSPTTLCQNNVLSIKWKWQAKSNKKEITQNYTKYMKFKK